MSRTKSDLPKLTGALLKRIETGVCLDFSTEETRRATLAEHRQKLDAARIEKVFELGRQLGYVPPLPPDWKVASGKDALETLQRLAGYYAYIAADLACRMNIPGFHAAKPKKWPIELVGPAVAACEHLKATGKAANDLAVCLEIVQAIDPEMARRTNRVKATAEAKQLRNEVAKLRATWKRQAAEAERVKAANTRPARLH